MFQKKGKTKRSSAETAHSVLDHTGSFIQEERLGFKFSQFIIEIFGHYM